MTVSPPGELLWIEQMLEPSRLSSGKEEPKLPAKAQHRGRWRKRKHRQSQSPHRAEPEVPLPAVPTRTANRTGIARMAPQQGTALNRPPASRPDPSPAPGRENCEELGTARRCSKVRGGQKRRRSTVSSRGREFESRPS